MTAMQSAPISGEILVDDTAGRRNLPGRDADSVIDADYFVVARDGDRHSDESSKPQPSAGAWAKPAASAGLPGDGLGILRAETALGEREPKSLSRHAFHAFAAVAIAATFRFSGGHALLRPEPVRSAAADSLKQVRIADLESRVVENASGKRIVLVKGTVSNDGRTGAGIPPLAVRVSAKSGGDQRYVFGTENRLLGGGESYEFAFRLDAPEGGVDKLAVEFSREP